MKTTRFLLLTIILLVLFVAAYFTLDLWGVALPIDKETLRKVTLTVVILDAIIVFLLIMLPPLLGRHGKGYDPSSGRVAQRKKSA